MSNDINAKFLNYVETSAKAMDLAEKIASNVNTEQKSAEDKVPAAQDLLKRAGLIDEDQEKAAAVQLSDHGQTLDILSNVLKHYQGEIKEAQAKVASATMGAGVDGVDRRTSQEKNANYVGRRRGLGENSPADASLLALIDR